MTTEKGTPTRSAPAAPMDSEVSTARRRLVKAALGAAPFALTLRSGAALANISAYQCINNDRGQVTRGTVVDAVTTPDIWERVTVKKHRLTRTRTITKPDGSTEEQVDVQFRYVPPGGGGFYLLNGGKLVEAPLEVGDPPWSSPPTDEVVPEDPVYVLYFWQPTDGDTDVYPLDPRTLIHPAYSVDQVTVAQFDELTPLTGSCMCSLNPDFTGCHG